MITPAPASSNRTVRGSGPNIDAMKSATSEAVRNCPSSSCLSLRLAVAASFMSSRYKTEFRFTIEQAGIVRRFERAPFPLEPDVAFAGLVGGHAAIAVSAESQSLASKPRLAEESVFVPLVFVRPIFLNSAWPGEWGNGQKRKSGKAEILKGGGEGRRKLKTESRKQKAEIRDRSVKSLRLCITAVNRVFPCGCCRYGSTEFRPTGLSAYLLAKTLKARVN